MSHDSATKASPQSAVRRIFMLTALLLTALGTPTATSAQWVRGTLVDQDTGTPIGRAAISALAPGNRRVGWTLTDASGRFFFRVRTGGSFVLRADRIGHASTLSESLEVGAADTLVYRMEAQVEAIQLVGLTVEAPSRDCRIRPEEGLATARVWEEVRKALDAAAETSRRGIYQFMVRRQERNLDARGRQVLEEVSRIDERNQRRPFRSLAAARLIDVGFVQPDGDGARYYAPDADVLLSDVFLDSHCFKLREGEGENDGLLGLDFEPTGDRRDVSDISGTLWVEAVSAELQRLEFRYENLDFSVGRAPVGGTVVFSGLPNGAWFVSDWVIRMPRLVEERRQMNSPDGSFSTRSRIRVAGIREESGFVLQVRTLSGDVVAESGSGTITGVVVTDDDESPVSDAVVSAWSIGQQATTGADGLFHFGSLGGGTYDLLVTHPSLTSLGQGGELTQVHAEPGEVTSVRLTIPSEKHILETACVGPGPDEGGIVVGWVTHAQTNEVIRDASVLLTMKHYLMINALTFLEKRSEVEALARDDGFFIYCGTSVDDEIHVDVTAEGMEPWTGLVETPYRGYVAHLTVRLEPKRKNP